MNRLEEAKRIIKAVDAVRDGDDEVEVPEWLQLGQDLRWYYRDIQPTFFMNLTWFPDYTMRRVPEDFGEKKDD